MCGRYAFLLPPEAMRQLFKILNEVDYPPRYNIAPTQPIITIMEREGRRTAELFRWGLVPGWVKDPRDWPLLINARSETMAEKPAYRDALRNSRCIVPATGYYEWKKGGANAKQPYYITAANDEPMAFAGLYSTWAGPNGEEVDTVCIVTVDPNPEISTVYDRMPAILTGDAIDAWLNTRDVDTALALQFIGTPPAGAMKLHPVARTVGRADAEGPELIAPVDPAEIIEGPRPKKRVASSSQLDLFG
jgi:putative SOS response-associated peptidase YedK